MFMPDSMNQTVRHPWGNPVQAVVVFRFNEALSGGSQS